MINRGVLLGACFLAILFFAGSVTAETKEEEAARYLDTMVQSILDDNDPMRNRMFIKLRYIGAPSTPSLLENLDHEESAVREYLAFTLGFFDEPGVIQPLIELFKGDEVVTVRTAAAEALGRLECADAVDLLVTALGESDPRVRQSAAYALGLIGDRRAEGPLKKAKTGDEDELVRFFAGDALVEIDRAEARRNRS